MPNNKNLRTCRYANCVHGKKIDLTKDEYQKIGKSCYYHRDCFEKKQHDDKESERQKADLQYIKNQWVLHINRALVYSELFRALNDLISKGISSDYLVFTVNYVINNHLPLRYPQGLKYYVAKDAIKKAYYKQRKPNTNLSEIAAANNTANTTTAKFTYKPKKIGFGSILNGGKNK